MNFHVAAAHSKSSKHKWRVYIAAPRALPDNFFSPLPFFQSQEFRQYTKYFRIGHSIAANAPFDYLYIHNNAFHYLHSERCHSLSIKSSQKTSQTICKWRIHSIALESTSSQTSDMLKTSIRDFSLQNINLLIWFDTNKDRMVQPKELRRYMVVFPGQAAYRKTRPQ